MEHLLDESGLAHPHVHPVDPVVRGAVPLWEGSAQMGELRVLQEEEQVSGEGADRGIRLGGEDQLRLEPWSELDHEGLGRWVPGHRDAPRHRRGKSRLGDEDAQIHRAHR